MTETALAAPAATAAMVPPALREPLARFLFAPDTWVVPASLGALLGLADSAVTPSRLDGAGVRRVVARELPPRRLPLDLLTGELQGRLALLDRAQWLRLGLCVSVLPFCGRILKSMDGNFRRVVREALDELTLEALDRQADVVASMTFVLGPGAWRAPERVAASGVRAALEQTCLWPDPVRQRFLLQFGPDELSGPPSVGGLNQQCLEIACKASLPDHPWLWS